MNHGLRHGIAQAIILSPILIFLVISVFWGLGSFTSNSQSDTSHRWPLNGGDFKWHI